MEVLLIMKFSIIIPVFNVEDYLKKAINSVIKQEYHDKEIILVNDGSTDASGKICDDFAKKYSFIKVIHKENSGVSDARNMGIDKATGEYILFLDADDYWKTNFLGELSSLIRKKNYPDFIFSNGEYRLNSEEINLKLHKFSKKKFNNLEAEETLKYILTNTNKNLFSVWRGIYKTKIIKKNEIKFESGISIGEDADWLFRFVLKSKCSFLYENPFYVYRVNRKNSAMNTKSKENLISFLKIIKKWIDLYESCPNHINKIICYELCNNYIENFKYIYNYEESFINYFINEINNSNLLKYVDSDFGNKIKNRAINNNLDSILRKLNFKWKIKNYIKFILTKLHIKKIIKKLIKL